MKKIFGIGIAILLIFQACDVVEGPYKETLVVGFCSPGDTIRKTLLEDYTGHICNNCPDAAIIAEDLEEIYGECLITMAVHVGFFARPIPDYTEDFRTPMGDEWDGLFLLGEALPKGMVNRIDFDTDHKKNKDDWPSLVEQQINLAPDALLHINGSYNPTTLKMDVEVSTTFLNDYPNGTTLGVYLLESGIVAPQKWQDESGNEIKIKDYVHNHMLRASFNGTWGDEITSSLAKAGDSFNNNYEMTIDTSLYNPDNLSVVAFVYDNETKEVIQAEKAHW